MFESMYKMLKICKNMCLLQNTFDKSKVIYNKTFSEANFATIDKVGKSYTHQ